MDHGRLSRKELQSLCKEHGIPANKTNVFMAEALNALLKTTKENDTTMQSVPDPAELVKSRANLKQAARSKKVADPVLGPGDVDDLASEFAMTFSIKPEKFHKADVMVQEQSDSGLLEETPAVAEVVAEPAKAVTQRRSSRTQQANANLKSVNSVPTEAPVLVEPALEEVFPVEKTIDTFISTAAEFHPISDVVVQEQSASSVVDEAPAVMQIVAEPAKAVTQRRSSRTQQAKANLKSVSSLPTEAPASVEPALEVISPLEKTTDALLSTLAEFHPNSDVPELREFGALNVAPAVVEVVAEPAKVVSQRRSSRTQQAKVNMKSVNSLANAAPASATSELKVVSRKEYTVDAFLSTSAEFPKSDVEVQDLNEFASLEATPAVVEVVLPLCEDNIVGEILSPVPEKVDEASAGSAQSNKSKLKRKNAKKVKAVSPVSVNILEDALPTDETKESSMVELPESPTLGLTTEMPPDQQVKSAANINDSPAGDAFEFHPVPESFAEIMTLVEETMGCQHRVGTRAVKETKKLESNTLELDDQYTPVKAGEDKENTGKNGNVDNDDLTRMSIRKLRKEAVKRGLSKRSNAKVKV